MCDIVPLNRYFVPQVLLTAILLGLGPTLAQAQLRPEAVPGGVAEIAVAAAGAPRPEVRSAPSFAPAAPEATRVMSSAPEQEATRVLPRQPEPVRPAAFAPDESEEK